MSETPNLVEMAKAGTPKQVIVKDVSKRRKSVYNAMKHGKYASVPLLCNSCHHRGLDVGGTGKCHAYAPDSVCTVRNELHDLIEKYDTRDPMVLKNITQEMIQMLFERVAFAEFTAKMDGNLLDKSTLAQANTLHKFIKLQSELGTTAITASEKTTEIDTQKQNIKEILKTVTTEQHG